MTSPETVRLYLLRDPETGRVAAQPQEFSDADTPPGLRGTGWERREVDVPVMDWRRMLLGVRGGGYGLEQQTDLHLQWWADGQEVTHS